MSPAEQKYGEVRVAWSRKDGVSVDLTRTHGLTDDDRRCVENAARNAAPAENGGWHRRADEWARGFPELGSTIDTSFGKPPPLLPPMPDFAAEWQAASASPEARDRLLSRLPDEVALEDDGCISFPMRPAFSDWLQRWLETAGARPDAFWDWDVARDGLFARLGIDAQHDQHAYVLANKSVILERTPSPPRPRFGKMAGQEVCLVKWDAKLQRELRARIEKRATCMTGDSGRSCFTREPTFRRGGRS